MSNSRSARNSRHGDGRQPTPLPPPSGRGGEAPISPLTLPKGTTAVMVFGGSFDPPHYFHTMGPIVAMTRLLPDTGALVYVPAAKSPHKPDGPAARDEHRLAMLKLALDIPARRSIWTDEIDRARWWRRRGVDRPSYTIDTLRRLRSILPAGIGLRLLIGADQAAKFHLWRECREIIKLATPAVMPREGIEMVTSLYRVLPDDFWTKAERAKWCEWMAPTVPMPGASASVRELIPRAPRDPERWERFEGLSDIITPVARYIAKHRLYGYSPTQRARGLTKRQVLDAEGEAWTTVIRSTVARAMPAMKRKFDRAPKQKFG